MTRSPPIRRTGELGRVPAPSDALVDLHLFLDPQHQQHGPRYSASWTRADRRRTFSPRVARSPGRWRRYVARHGVVRRGGVPNHLLPGDVRYGGSTWLLRHVRHLGVDVSGGMDVRIHVAKHLSLVPGARLLYAKRRDYLTGDGFRGPYTGGGLMPSIGLALRWTAR